MATKPALSVSAVVYVDPVEKLPPEKQIDIPDGAQQALFVVERSTSTDPLKWPDGGVCWVLFVDSGSGWNFYGQFSAFGGVQQERDIDGNPIKEIAEGVTTFWLPPGKSRRLRLHPIYFTDSPPFDLRYAVDFK